jgi:hypothetical protein
VHELVLLNICDSNMHGEGIKKFFERFSKSTLISNFVKIYPVGGDLFHAGGLTDVQLILASRDFAKTPKTWPVPVAARSKG